MHDIFMFVTCPWWTSENLVDKVEVIDMDLIRVDSNNGP